MKTIGFVLLIVSTVTGFLFWADNRYAQQTKLKAVEQRLDYKIIFDQYQATNQRIWTIEDRCGKQPCDQTTTEELRNLKETKEVLKTKMDVLEKSTTSSP